MLRTNSSSARNGLTNTKNNSIWTARRWFTIFGVVLTLWTVVYLFSHTSLNINGYEHTKFTAADIRHINSILISNNEESLHNGSHPLATSRIINNTNDGFLDSYDIDTLTTSNYTGEYRSLGNRYNNQAEEDKKARIRKALIYISSQYGSEINHKQLNNIEQYISTFTPKETGIFLADYKLKVESFFWLSGALVYAEVIFWVVFGVLCSLLFFTGNALRKGSSNNTQRDIMYQLARLFYAPFMAVILVLIYTYLNGGTTLHVEAGEGIIIMAFLVGVSSGIGLEWMDRLRNNKVPAEAPADNMPMPQHKTQPAEPSVNNSADFEQSEYTVTNYSEKPDEDIKPQTPEAKEHHEVKPWSVNEHEIREVGIDLKLDFGGLFDDERAQLQRLGFSKAIVTLHNVNGKDIIPAKKVNDDMTTFMAADVKPGIYIARATLSQRLRDDQIINLFGEKTAYITEDKPGLELYVKKYEATA